MTSAFGPSTNLANTTRRLVEENRGVQVVRVSQDPSHWVATQVSSGWTILVSTTS